MGQCIFDCYFNRGLGGFDDVVVVPMHDTSVCSHV